MRMCVCVYVYLLTYNTRGAGCTLAAAVAAELVRT